LFWKKEAVFHIKFGETPPAYVLSAIFAPTSLRVGILHEWSIWDEKSLSWTVKNQVRYELQGGRDGGYRGYSKKDSITPGRWRVRIMTDQGQKVGTIYFTVEADDGSSAILTKTL
jgi:hypothetical protein